jgi:hypothetical protein
MKDGGATYQRVIIHLNNEAGVWQWSIYREDDHGNWLNSYRSLQAAQDFCKKEGFEVVEIMRDEIPEISTIETSVSAEV